MTGLNAKASTAREIMSQRVAERDAALAACTLKESAYEKVAEKSKEAEAKMALADTLAAALEDKVLEHRRAHTAALTCMQPLCGRPLRIAGPAPLCRYFVPPCAATFAALRHRPSPATCLQVLELGLAKFEAKEVFVSAEEARETANDARLPRRTAALKDIKLIASRGTAELSVVDKFWLFRKWVSEGSHSEDLMWNVRRLFYSADGKELVSHEMMVKDIVGHSFDRTHAGRLAPSRGLSPTYPTSSPSLSTLSLSTLSHARSQLCACRSAGPGRPSCPRWSEALQGLRRRSHARLCRPGGLLSDCGVQRQRHSVRRWRRPILRADPGGRARHARARQGHRPQRRQLHDKLQGEWK